MPPASRFHRSICVPSRWRLRMRHALAQRATPTVALVARQHVHSHCGPRPSRHRFLDQNASLTLGFGLPDWRNRRVRHSYNGQRETRG